MCLHPTNAPPVLPLDTAGAHCRAAMFRHWPLVAGVLLIIVRLLLVSDLPMTALAFATYDDQLFVRLADTISRHRWLGAYDQMTLMKGPGYSLFMAACRVIGLPLKNAQHLLYIAFCVTFVAAIRPWIRRRWLGLVLLAILLFNPVSFHSGEMARVVREGIYPALGGLVLAFALGLAARAGGPLRMQWIWSGGLGFWLGLFWITREEGVWLLPAVGVLLGWSVIVTYRTQPRCVRRLAVPALSIGICLAVINTVCMLNLWTYGEYTTVEFRSRSFLDAYGALLRIDSGLKPARVPVPRASREMAYAVSPEFRRLQSYLEGPAGRSWIECSEKGAGVKNDFAGGWFMWALRDGAYASEHFTSAAEAMRFYRTMARQINMACDSKLIPAGPRRSGMTPPWESRYAAAAARAWLSGLRNLTTFSQCYPGIGYSGGADEHLQLFERTTRSPLAPCAPVDGRGGGHYAVAAGGFRAQCREWIVAAYQHGTVVALVIAALALMIRLPRLWRCNRLLPLAAIAIVTVMAFRLAILAWIDATSFSGTGILYLSPLYVMMLALICLGAIAIWTPPKTT